MAPPDGDATALESPPSRPGDGIQPRQFLKKALNHARFPVASAPFFGTMVGA